MTKSAITAVAMKRHLAPIAERSEGHTFLNNREVFLASDIETRDQQIIGLLAKLPHDEDCEAHRLIYQERDGTLVFYGCNCPHADIMALLRETVR